MRDDEGYGASSLFLSFLLGGIVGAGVALLLAPQSGTETRRKIKEFAEDVKEKTGGYVDNVKETVSSKINQGKEYVEEKKSIISTAIEAGKEAYVKEKEKHEKA